MIMNRIRVPQASTCDYEKEGTVHRKSGILFASGLLLLLMVAACGQAMPAQTPSPTTESPSTAMEHFARGVELSTAGQFQEAADEYQKALAVDPKNVDAMTNLGVTYYSLERFDDAIAQYLQAIELAPNDGDIHSNLAAAHVQKYELTGSQAQLDKALEEYEKAVELKPDLAEAHFGLGELSMHLWAASRTPSKRLRGFRSWTKGTARRPPRTRNSTSYGSEVNRCTN